MLLRAAVLSNLIWILCCTEDWKFSPQFKFGTASSAYQIEGAWNVSGKGESVWDSAIHKNPEITADHSNGDVACDSYHQWRRDVQMLSELGVQFYRFSISWSRLLPTGFANYINEDGKNFYNNLINELLRNGIKPVVTMYHESMPQKLQDLGGWTNPLIVNWFAEFARVLFSLYGDRVKTWITLNEPLMICDVPYNSMLSVSGFHSDIGLYLCGRNTMLAHAKAWRIYDEEFRYKYKGQIGITNHLIWYEAATPEDEELTALVREHGIGRYSQPIYSSEGGWPKAISKIIAENSKREGYFRSKLPEFTKKEVDFIKGTYDFYGINFYTSRLVRKARPGEKIPLWPFDGASELGAVLEGHPKWKAESSWFLVYPKNFRLQLAWMKKKYGDINFFVVECGYGNTENSRNDTEKVNYHRDNLKQILLSIKEDGVNVTGYTAWSLMDSFEWFSGYTYKFGLYEVNFTDPERTRTPRLSAKYYAKVIKERSMDVTSNV